MFEEFSGLREARFENHFPHVPVNMMDPCAARAPSPHRSEEGNPVPDLDDAVTGAQTPEHFADNCCGEHHEATVFADDSVAVSSAGVGMALGIGGPHRDIDSSLGPKSKDPGGVELRTSGFNIDEISPSENVNSLNTSVFGECRDIADRRRSSHVVSGRRLMDGMPGVVRVALNHGSISTRSGAT